MRPSVRVKTASVSSLLALLLVAAPLAAQPKEPPKPAAPAPESAEPDAPQLDDPPEPAPSPTGPSDADVESARSLMKTGLDKYSQGDFAAALADFKAADALMGVTTTGLWTGKALEKLGRLIEARNALRAASLLPEEPGESEAIRNARGEAAQLSEAIAPRIPSVTLSLSGQKPGTEVEVRVDGEVLRPDLITRPRKVDPGKHRVTATGAGYRDVSLEIEVAEGEDKQLTLKLLEQADDPTPPPPPPPDELPVLTITGFSIAAVGGILGGVFGGLSLSEASDAKQNCVGNFCPAANEPAGDRSLTFAHVSTVSFAVAGAGAVLGIVGAVIELGGDGSGGDEVSATITPYSDGQSLGVVGTF